MRSNFAGTDRTHYSAVFLGCLLLVLIIMTFVTFAFGSYTVFNHPNSNVVAQTLKTSTGSIVLAIEGSSFSNNTRRTVWVDPSFLSSNPSLLNMSSGVPIGNVTINSEGNLPLQNISLTDQQFQKIVNDGRSPHSVWIVGNAGLIRLGGSNFINMTFDSQQNYTSASTGNGIYFFLSLLVFSLPVSFTFGQLFIILWTIYLILFAVSLNGPFRNLLGSFRDAAREGVSGLLGNSAFAIFLIFPVALWGSIALALLQQSAGIPTGNLPPTDPLLQFVELTLAPLREEIGFRVIPIGIVALFILLSRRRVKDGIMALWHPSRYLKKADSVSDYQRHRAIMYTLIGISAVIFGAAHVLLGAGWDVGKISQAAAVGVALGVLYYQYGFAATVLLHWAFDYVIDSYTTNGLFLNIYNYYILFSAVVAIASTIAMVMLLARKLAGRHPMLSSNPNL